MAQISIRKVQQRNIPIILRLSQSVAVYLSGWIWPPPPPPYIVHPSDTRVLGQCSIHTPTPTQRASRYTPALVHTFACERTKHHQRALVWKYIGWICTRMSQPVVCNSQCSPLAGNMVYECLLFCWSCRKWNRFSLDDVIHELEHTETVALDGAAMDGGYGWDWEARGSRPSGSNGVKPNCEWAW